MRMEIKELVKALRCGATAEDIAACEIHKRDGWCGLCINSYISSSASALESMQEELDRVKAERDAAVEDLECLMKATWYYSCQFCDPCNRSCAVKSKKDRACRPKWRGLEGRTSHE